MHKNIHSHTYNGGVMDISIKYKHRYKWQTLSTPRQNWETESSTWTSTTSILHIKEISQDNDKLGKIINGCSKDKGMLTQICKNGAQIHYSFFSLTNYPLLMHPSSSTYSPSIGSEGSSQGVSRNMEDQ